MVLFSPVRRLFPNLVENLVGKKRKLKDEDEMEPFRNILLYILLCLSVSPLVSKNVKMAEPIGPKGLWMLKITKIYVLKFWIFVKF